MSNIHSFISLFPAFFNLIQSRHLSVALPFQYFYSHLQPFRTLFPNFHCCFRTLSPNFCCCLRTFVIVSEPFHRRFSVYTELFCIYTELFLRTFFVYRVLFEYTFIAYRVLFWGYFLSVLCLRGYLRGDLRGTWGVLDFLVIIWGIINLCRRQS